MICVDIDLLYVKWTPNGAIVPDHVTQSAEVIGKGGRTTNTWLTEDQNTET